MSVNYEFIYCTKYQHARLVIHLATCHFSDFLNKENTLHYVFIPLTLCINVYKRSFKYQTIQI